MVIISFVISSSVNAVNETSMRSCIDQFYFEDIFHFLIIGQELHWSSVYFEDGDQNIASNPRYRGISQTGSFAICSDFYFIFLLISFIYFHILSNTMLINVDLVLIICWDFYLNIWWKGPSYDNWTTHVQRQCTILLSVFLLAFLLVFYLYF